MAQASSPSELHQNREPIFLGSSRELTQNPPYNPDFDPPMTKNRFPNFVIHYHTSKGSQNTYKQEFITLFHHTFNIKSFFTKNSHFHNFIQISITTPTIQTPTNIQVYIIIYQVNLDMFE